MKKLLFSIILFMMFMPMFVNAETCDTDKISISSITVESKTDSVEELDEATANGKSINLNLSMSNVGDNIEYKIVVKNDSNEDYELDKNSLNISSDFIKYTLESEDDTNIVKANSSKVVYLKVNYANEVPDDAFESGTYNDNKSITLNLSTGDTINVPDTLKNPNTGVQSYILILFIILLVSITVYVLLKKMKYTKFMILIIGTAIIIPISVCALCTCEIKVDSNVEINKKSICITEGVVGEIHLLPYIENVTWNQYYEMVDDKTKEELDFLWESHESERKTGFITSKCMLVDGRSGDECYSESVHNPGPFTDEETYEENFFGFRSENEIILDSTKICYTYID